MTMRTRYNARNTVDYGYQDGSIFLSANTSIVTILDPVSIQQVVFGWR